MGYSFELRSEAWYSERKERQLSPFVLGRCRNGDMRCDGLNMWRSEQWIGEVVMVVSLLLECVGLLLLHLHAAKSLGLEGGCLLVDEPYIHGVEKHTGDTSHHCYREIRCHGGGLHFTLVHSFSFAPVAFLHSFLDPLGNGGGFHL